MKSKTKGLFFFIVFQCSLDQPLPTTKYQSYFSLIKAVFDPLNDKKAELAKVKECV